MKIELTKSEVDNLNFRNSLIQSKFQEVKLLQREASIYANELVSKYGEDVNDLWKFDGNCLVKEDKDGAAPSNN